MRPGLWRDSTAVVSDLNEKKLAVAARADIDVTRSTDGVNCIIDEVRPNLVNSPPQAQRRGSVRSKSRVTVTFLSLWPRMIRVFSMPSCDFLPWRLVHERIGLHRAQSSEMRSVLCEMDFSKGEVRGEPVYRVLEILRRHRALGRFQIGLIDSGVHQCRGQIPSVRDFVRVEPTFDRFLAIALF